MNAEVVFIVRGGREPHKRFRDRFKVRPRILIDDDGTFGDDYDVYLPHCEEGVGYPVYKATSVYLIDQYGKLSQFWILSGPRGRPSPECLLGILALAKQNDWTY